MQERKISKFFLECWQWQKTCKELFTPTLNEIAVNVRYVFYASRSTFLVEWSVAAQKNKGDKKYGSEDGDTFSEVERKH